MRIHDIHGLIRRRILVNFRVDPAVMQNQLPPKFRPRLHNGFAIAGICLIRLENIRSRYLLGIPGFNSENAAHRIAVLWDDDEGRVQEGVFIPRRDTDSLLNHFAGGRIFPGEHHHAHFEIETQGDLIDFEMKSKDGVVTVQLSALVARELPPTSGFHSLQEASRFFETGGIGYSATSGGLTLDGIQLVTKTWQVEPLTVKHVFSSYFSDERLFPKGSVSFDCALLMRNIEHEWRSLPDLHLDEQHAA
jgi:hypothetical protein